MLLVAIPIGRLGDHHGRRKILALALVGVAGSLIEVFTVCECPKIFRYSLLSALTVLCAHLPFRCFPEVIPDPACLAIVDTTSLRRWTKFGIGIYVGNGLRVNSC